MLELSRLVNSSVQPYQYRRVRQTTLSSVTMLHNAYRPIANIIGLRGRFVSHKTQLWSPKKSQTIKMMLTKVEQILLCLIPNHTETKVEIQSILAVLVRIHCASWRPDLVPFWQKLMQEMFPKPTKEFKLRSSHKNLLRSIIQEQKFPLPSSL